MTMADVTWMDDYRAAAAEAAPVTYGTDVLGMADVYDPGFLGFDAEEQGWQEQALCAQTDPEAFFPEKGGSTREAKKICVGCEVKRRVPGVRAVQRRALRHLGRPVRARASPPASPRQLKRQPPRSGLTGGRKGSCEPSPTASPVVPTSCSSVDRPTPDPGPGEVRVRLAFSGVNPTDWKSRTNAQPGPGGQVPEPGRLGHRRGRRRGRRPGAASASGCGSGRRPTSARTARRPSTPSSRPGRPCCSARTPPSNWAPASASPSSPRTAA